MPPTPDTTTPGTRPGPWRAVEQRLVHKVAAGEVLVTDLAPLTPGLVAVAARWPAGHRLYDRRAGTVGHLLLVVETIRQAGLCVAHAHLGVPLGEQFIFHRMTVRLAAPVSDLAGTEPAGTVTMVEPTPRFRVGRPCGATLAVEIRHEGHPWAIAEADYSWAPRRVYDRLRAAGRAAVAPSGAGRLVPHPRDPGHDEGTAGGGTPVAVDLTDPTFFDHEVDHLPGMLLIDAALRAAAARAGAALVGLDVAFDRFAELDRATWVRTRSVRQADGPAVDVRLGQGEETVARASVLVGAGGPGLRPATRAAAAAGPAPRTRPAAPAGPAGR